MRAAPVLIRTVPLDSGVVCTDHGSDRIVGGGAVPKLPPEGRWTMFSLFTKKHKVSDLQPETEVTVEGRVSVPEPITVPGAGIRCACYFVLNEAWQHGARGRGRKMWVPTGAQNKCGGFFLDDGTGRVWVAACEGNELDIGGGEERSGGLGKKGTGRYLARLVGEGAKVRVRGVVSRPKASEPADGLVVRPGGKRRVLSIKHLRAG